MSVCCGSTPTGPKTCATWIQSGGGCGNAPALAGSDGTPCTGGGDCMSKCCGAPPTDCGGSCAGSSCKTCVYVMEQIKRGVVQLLPVMCSNLFALPQLGSYDCCQHVLRAISVNSANVRSWITEGCYIDEVYGGREWASPCPSHVICAALFYGDSGTCPDTGGGGAGNRFCPIPVRPNPFGPVAGGGGAAPPAAAGGATAGGDGTDAAAGAETAAESSSSSSSSEEEAVDPRATGPRFAAFRPAYGFPVGGPAGGGATVAAAAPEPDGGVTFGEPR